MTILLLAALLSWLEPHVLRAGRDVPVPERIHHVPPTYPPEAREVIPRIMGIIVLDVTLSEEGQPIDIRVVRGTPLIDRAAIEAVKQWRYKPTVVGGIPRQVIVLEVVDVFPDESSRLDYFATMLKDKKEAQAVRLLAIERLQAIGPSEKAVVTALQEAAEDADESIKSAATEALRSLGTSEK